MKLADVDSEQLNTAVRWFKKHEPPEDNLATFCLPIAVWQRLYAEIASEAQRSSALTDNTELGKRFRLLGEHIDRYYDSLDSPHRDEAGSKTVSRKSREQVRRGGRNIWRQ